MLIELVLLGKTINMTSDNIAINSTNFKVDRNGNMICNSARIATGNAIIYQDGNIWIKDTQNYDNAHFRAISSDGYMFSRMTSNGFFAQDNLYGEMSQMTPSGIITPDISADTITQSSLESKKKNFEKLKNGLDIVKNTDIYKYNLKKEKDKNKKHIGLVIGDKFNYSNEIINENNDGVDIYSMVAVAYKAIQEQQEEIELLKEEIEFLKEEIRLLKE